ncbi:MAG TPA: YitT family protein [Firmicutes bacterium]|nr:YitT family protein [Bacillota bacterium]
MRRFAYILEDVLMITVAALLTALALNWFLIPNRIAAGGVSGLATIIYHWTGISVGILSLAINLPLLVLAIAILGWSVAAKTVMGTVLLSLFLELSMPFVQPLTYDPLLAAVAGGLLAGVGLGLAFRGGGSTGGTDIAAQLLQHRSRRQGIGTYLLLADGFVLVMAGIAFSPELALYALVALIATSVVIDMVLEGLPYARQALIIISPEKATEVSQAIFKHLERGVTALPSKGMYTQTDRCTLLVVVVRGELRLLTDLVARVDPTAFVIISDIRTVYGEGFDQPRRIK